MSYRYRPLTLLEVVIGFALTGILLTFLFSGLRHVTSLDCKVEQARRVVHSRSIMQLRLSQLFERLVPGKEEATFFIDSHPMSFHHALYFSVNNEIDRDQKFCGTLKGSLYLDGKKQLCLTLVSGKSERKEVLLDSVTSFSFTCFDPQKKEWKTEWGEKSCPTMLKLRLNKEVVFAFILKEVS